MPIPFYEHNANQLAEMYRSKNFNEVHGAYLEHFTAALTKQDARILDLGAGAGRDSQYLAQQGAAYNVSVIAVEPAKNLAALGKQYTQGLNVHWLQDSLPDLNVVTKQMITAKENGFDLILLSAVWMHIPDPQREHSLRQFANLLTPNGKLIISLRHGPSGDERKMHDVSSDLLIRRANAFSLFPILVTDINEDMIGRDEVKWQTVVLQLSGAFSFICHVALNDGKAANMQ